MILNTQLTLELLASSVYVRIMGIRNDASNLFFFNYLAACLPAGRQERPMTDVPEMLVFTVY